MLYFVLESCDFLNTDISQGSVATCFGCGGVFKYDFVTNFLLSRKVKEFWKSVNIWWSYGQQFGVLFFWTHGGCCLCNQLLSSCLRHSLSTSDLFIPTPATLFFSSDSPFSPSMSPWLPYSHSPSQNLSVFPVFFYRLFLSQDWLNRLLANYCFFWAILV